MKKQLYPGKLYRPISSPQQRRFMHENKDMGTWCEFPEFGEALESMSSQLHSLDFTLIYHLLNPSFKMDHRNPRFTWFDLDSFILHKNEKYRDFRKGVELGRASLLCVPSDFVTKALKIAAKGYTHLEASEEETIQCRPIKEGVAGWWKLDELRILKQAMASEKDSSALQALNWSHYWDGVIKNLHK